MLANGRWDLIRRFASETYYKIVEVYVAITPLCRLNEVCRFETGFSLLCIYSVCEING